MPRKRLFFCLFSRSIPGCPIQSRTDQSTLRGTAFGNQFWNANLLQPMSSVPVVMNQFAGSPYETWQTLAWAGALVLTLFVLLVSLFARWIVLRNKVAND